MDRHNFGGKQSKWRWGRLLSWNIPEFCSMGGARWKKNSIFRVFTVPFDYLVHSLQETVLPQINSTDGKLRLKVYLLLVWRVCDQTFCRYAKFTTRCKIHFLKWSVPKSDHMTIMKIENLHIDTCRKIQWFQKCYYFRSMTKNNEVITENPFQNSGITRRLAILNWRLSPIHPSSYYY